MRRLDDLLRLFNLLLLVRLRHQLQSHSPHSEHLQRETATDVFGLKKDDKMDNHTSSTSLNPIAIIIISMLGFDLRRASQLHRFRTQFEDLGSVGSGGFAEVRRVRGRLDLREYAAKVVRIKPSQGVEEAEERFFRYLAEPRAHAQLTHPNILPYHGCWLQLEGFSEQQRAELTEDEPQQDPEFEMVVLDESLSSDGIVFGSASNEPPPLQQSAPRRETRTIGDGSKLADYKEARLYLLSELAEMDLSAFLHRRSRERKVGPLNAGQLRDVYRMGLEMLAGLSFLHAKRIIHRDIKLHNVVLDREGRCKLIDFGLAKRVKHWKTSIEHHPTMLPGTEEERFSSEVGTKLFSSPEQASSEKYDYRTDIYSLAVVIVLLFHSYSTAHEQRELLEKVRKRALDEMAIPQPLKTLLFRCLGSENERPSLGQLKKCLKDLLRELSKKEEETPLQEKGKTRCRGTVEKEETPATMVEVKES